MFQEPYQDVRQATNQVSDASRYLDTWMSETIHGTL